MAEPQKETPTRADDVLREPAAESSPGTRDYAPAAEPISEPGAGADAALPDRLGRYRVLARLGAGGFGVVYRARDDDLQRDVAVKVPHRRRVQAPQDVEAYFAEARTLAGLRHPGIVPVYDVGRTDDGLCYVVSEFVQGSDLAARLAAGRLTPAAAADLVARVAEALHRAHRRCLVHRDVNPANILLDADGRPVLAAFGLALREEDFGRGSDLAGTPAYMSPEQARGEGHRIESRTDIYSLGVVLYELLTRCRPFRADSLDTLLEQVQTREPPPPRLVEPGVPRELERICLKAPEQAGGRPIRDRARPRRRPRSVAGERLGAATTGGRAGHDRDSAGRRTGSGTKAIRVRVGREDHWGGAQGPALVRRR